MLYWLIDILRQIFIDDVWHVDISFLPRNLTEHYKKELWNHHLNAIYIATEYREIEDYLAKYKFYSQREYVDLFGDLMSKLDKKYQIFEDKKSILVPVPMHWSRYFSRWFDHNRYLIKHMAKNVDISYEILLSTSWTSHQSKLSRIKRLENKKNSLKMNHSRCIPDTVILFDDVISTWSTATECARVLKEAGVKKVIWIFLASNL